MFIINQHNISTGDPRFIFTIDTTKGTGASFTLPLRILYNYDFVIDWGDSSTSTITAYDDPDITHTYSAGGVYQLKISGTCEAWYFNNGGDRLKFTQINNWGNINISPVGLNNAFRGCTNLTVLPNEPLTYTNLTDLAFTFGSCTGLTGTKIPYNFLYKLSNLQNLQQCFQSVNMELYDDFLRYCPNLTNVSYLHYAVTLTDKYIPEDYFYYNKLITNYSYVFATNRNMILPTRLFDLSALSIVTTFANFMDVTSTTYSPTGTIQDIWNYTTATSTDAFDQCTAITNYADIPTSWK